MSDTPLPDDDVSFGVGSFGVGCGCGQTWNGATAWAGFSAHECPLAGVDTPVEELIANVLDPSGVRRAHASEIAEAIEQGHFTVQPVFPTLAYGVHFAYTIGLWPDHGGELIVRGFGDGCSQAADLYGTWVRQGVVKLEAGEYPSARCRVVPWAGDPYDFGQAMAHHGTEDFPRWQIVLADSEGRFPGDPGCEVETHQMKGLPTA